MGIATTALQWCQVVKSRSAYQGQTIIRARAVTALRVHGIAERVPPPKSLVDSCMAALKRSKDARLLVPALGGLSRTEALAVLPKLLALDAAGFKAAMHRLMLPQPETGKHVLSYSYPQPPPSSLCLLLCAGIKL